MLNKRCLTINDIAGLQDTLNANADKENPDWKSIRTVDDFNLAAALEIAELIESAPWKWWKKGGEVDWWNVKIEVIDAIHFMVSTGILTGFKGGIGADVNLGNDKKDTPLFDGNRIDRKYALKLLMEVGSFNGELSILDKVANSVGLTSDEISAIYVAKRALNNIRWQSDYGDKYQKLKDGIEDNVFLEEIVEEFLKDESLNLKDLELLVQEKLSVG